MDHGPAAVSDWRKPGAHCRFVRYFVAIFLSCGVVAVQSVIFWSHIFNLGTQALEGAKASAWVSYVCGAVVGAVLLLLYLMDFFWPPHIPGRWMTLYPGDVIVGPGLLALALGVGWIGLIFTAESMPGLPPLLTSFASPVALLLVRLCLGEKLPPLPENTLTDNIVTRLEVLKNLHKHDRDVRMFFRAAGTANLLIATGVIVLWIKWRQATEHPDTTDWSEEEVEDYLILRVSPIFTAVIFYYVTFLCWVRLIFGRGYEKTDCVRNNILSSMLGHYNDKMLLMHRKTVHSITGARGFENMPREQQEEYLRQHVRYIAWLEYCAGALVCAFIIVIGSAYCFGLFAGHGRTRTILAMSKAFLIMAFITAVGFLYVAFNRIWSAIGNMLHHLPIVKSIIGMSTSDWVRASGVFLFLPIVPLALALSALNQCVRRHRGLAQGEEAPAMATNSTVDANKSIKVPQTEAVLTWRFHQFLLAVRTWSWASILDKVFILGISAAILGITPIMLNVMLAWMSTLLQPCNFSAILAAVWLLGLILFLLPPVPGAPIYLFGGVLIAGKGQEVFGGQEGFWIGAVVSIVLGWTIKLSACAIQQKCFGEYLGSHLWVRQTIGVHKSFIRAIEYALRQPGFSFGKVIILIAGPDWPTSVLAGVLRLSVIQCELGTTPVLIYIAPLSLTGSFYYKKSEGEIWKNAGDLVFLITTLETVILWALMGWAIQDVVSKRGDKLTKPLAKYVDLEWLDYREAEISKNTVLSLGQVPWPIRACFIVACGCSITVGHLYTWVPGYCFGEFNITDDINGLSWYSEEGAIFSDVGMFGLIMSIVAFLFYSVFAVWRNRRSARLRRGVVGEIDQEEDDWKERYLNAAAAAAAEEETSAVRSESTVEKGPQPLQRLLESEEDKSSEPEAVRPIFDDKQSLSAPETEHPLPELDGSRPALRPEQIDLQLCDHTDRSPRFCDFDLQSPREQPMRSGASCKRRRCSDKTGPSQECKLAESIPSTVHTQRSSARRGSGEGPPNIAHSTSSASPIADPSPLVQSAERPMVAKDSGTRSGNKVSKDRPAKPKVSKRAGKPSVIVAKGVRGPETTAAQAAVAPSPSVVGATASD